jgi:hypothetical protein
VTIPCAEPLPLSIVAFKLVLLIVLTVVTGRFGAADT